MSSTVRRRRVLLAGVVAAAVLVGAGFAIASLAGGSSTTSTLVVSAPAVTYSTITPMATITFQVANRANAPAVNCVAQVRFASTPHGIDAGKVFSSKGEPEVTADTSETFSFVYDVAPGAHADTAKVWANCNGVNTKAVELATREPNV